MLQTMAPQQSEQLMIYVYGMILMTPVICLEGSIL